MGVRKLLPGRGSPGRRRLDKRSDGNFEGSGFLVNRGVKRTFRSI